MEFLNNKINSAEELCDEINDFFDKSKYVSIGEKKITGNVREWFENNLKIIKSQSKTLELLPKLFVIYFVNLLKGYTVQDEDKCWQYLFKKHFGYSKYNIKYTEFYSFLKNAFAKSEHILFQVNSRNMYYQTLAFHAFAPVESFESFLDVLWNIHLTRPDDTYFEEDYLDIVDAFINCFKKSTDEESNIDIGSQSYNIKAGLKYFALCDKDGFRELIKKCLFLISLYYDKAGQSDEDTYLTDLFNGWWEKLNKSPKEKEIKKRQPTVRDYKDVSIKYSLDNMKGVFIHFPQLRIKNSETLPILEIFNGDKRIPKKTLDTNGNGFLQVISPFDIFISDFDMEEIKIRIVITLDDVIFDSQEDLYRDIIIFSNGNECQGRKLRKGLYSIYSLQEFDCFCNATCISHQNINDVYNVNLNIGDDFIFNNETYHIYDENLKSNQGFEIMGNKYQNVSLFVKNEELPIYKNNFSINIDNPHEYMVSFKNGQAFPLNIALNNKAFANCDDIVTISKAQSNEIIFKAYITSSISYKFEKPFYYNQKEMSYLEFNNNKIAFYSNIDNITSYIKAGKLLFQIPRISWTIKQIMNENQFRCLDKFLWFKNFDRTATLSLNLPSTVSSIVVSVNNKCLNEQNGDYLLGDFLFQEEFQDNLLVVWMKINNESFQICRIATKPMITQKPQLIYENGFFRVGISPSSFTGPDDRNFVFSLKNDTIDDIVFDETLKEVNLPMGIYQFSIICKYDKNPFTNKEKAIKIFEDKFINGSIEEVRFLNKELLINTLRNFDDKQLQIKKDYYIKNLQFYKNIDGFDKYLCDICVNQINGEYRTIYGNIIIEIIDESKCLLLFYDDADLLVFDISKSTGRIETNLYDQKDGYQFNYLEYKEIKKTGGNFDV